MRNLIDIFGIRINGVRLAEAVDCVYELIASDSGSCRYVVTPNLDHLVLLSHHSGLRQAYDDASLVLADGMPVVLTSRLLKRGIPERVTGSDLVPALFDEAAARGGLRVFLLGAAEGVAEVAAERIHERWPAVKVVGLYSPPFGFEKDQAENDAIVARIAATAPDVLVVGLGAPKQELWLHAQRHRLTAAVGLCVGATIDFLAGERRRAPRWMQKTGLEWMHRVATEPRRLAGRYARDAWHFPAIFFQEWRRGRTRVGTPVPSSELPAPHARRRTAQTSAQPENVTAS